MEKRADQAVADTKRFPLVPDAYARGAAVPVTGGNGGKDYVVEALTGGGFVGRPTAFTGTHFTVIAAPAGQAEGLAKAWEALPPMTISPMWRQKDDAHTVAALERMQAEGRQQTAQVEQSIRDYNARQASFNARQKASMDAARGAQQRRADQSLEQSQQSQQSIRDQGQQTIDSRDGTNRYYTFCNKQTGAVVYQYDTTVAPDTSGSWLRCGD